VQPAFDIGVLAGPTALIFLAVLVAAWRITRSPWLTCCLAVTKAGVFLIYYGWGFDGSFTFLDDWTYLERGSALHAEGVGLGNVIDSLPLLLAAGEGNPFLYYLHNAVAIDWFGDGYYAPVAMNVLTSVAIAWLATRLVLAERLCPARSAALYFSFILLHPDITAWSTVMNGKDTLVLLLHVLLLTAVSFFLRGWRWRALLLAAGTVGVLLFLRFYVPLMFALALAITAALQVRGATRWRLLGLSLVGLAGLAWNLGSEGIGFVRETLLADLVNPLEGFLRFLLTPIPFNTEPAYAFLNFPALLHWLLMPATLLGVWQTYRFGTPFARYLVTYAAVFAALYAVYGELQGPRHRLQLDFAWATFQFVGLRAALRLASMKRNGHRPHALNPGTPV